MLYTYVLPPAKGLLVSNPSKSRLHPQISAQIYRNIKLTQLERTPRLSCSQFPKLQPLRQNGRLASRRLQLLPTLPRSSIQSLPSTRLQSPSRLRSALQSRDRKNMANDTNAKLQHRPISTRQPQNNQAAIRRDLSPEPRDNWPRENGRAGIHE